MPVMYKNTEWGPKVVDNTRLAVIVGVTVVTRHNTGYLTCPPCPPPSFFFFFFFIVIKKSFSSVRTNTAIKN